MRISLEFTCKWTIKNNENYVFTESHKMLVNLKSGKIINQIIKGGSLGYIINSKFYSLTKLKKMIVKIEQKENLPF
jgi:hypothetical protein